MKVHIQEMFLEIHLFDFFRRVWWEAFGNVYLNIFHFDYVSCFSNT